MKSKSKALPLANLCILAAASLLCPVVARAADEPPYVPKLPRFLRLEYVRDAASKCPEREVLEDAVLASALRDPFNSAAGGLLWVKISRRGALYQAILEVRDSAGSVLWTRPFDPRSSCMNLVQDVGFVVGNLIRDPPAPKIAPAPPFSPVLPKVAPAPALLKVAPAPAPSFEWPRLELGLAGALAVRTVSTVFAFNLVANAGVHWRSFSAVGELRFTPPEAAAVDATGREIVSVTHLSVGLVPCEHFREFLYCGVGQVIAVIEKGAPGVEPASSTNVSTAIGLRGAFNLPLPMGGRRFAIRLSVDALVTLGDVVLHFSDVMPSNAGDVHATWTTPRFTVNFGVGLVTHLRLN